MKQKDCVDESVRCLFLCVYLQSNGCVYITLNILHAELMTRWEQRQGGQDHFANRFIQGNGSQVPNVKGSCKQLNQNKTLTGEWPAAGSLRACEHSPYGCMD